MTTQQVVHIWRQFSGPVKQAEWVMKEYSPPGLFADVIGIQITSMGSGKAEGRMAMEPCVQNPFGLAHLGAIVGFADTIADCAAMAWANRDNDGKPAIAAITARVEEIKLASNTRSGVIHATATMMSDNPDPEDVQVSVVVSKEGEGKILGEFLFHIVLRALRI